MSTAQTHSGVQSGLDEFASSLLRLAKHSIDEAIDDGEASGLAANGVRTEPSEEPTPNLPPRIPGDPTPMPTDPGEPIPVPTLDRGEVTVEVRFDDPAESYDPGEAVLQSKKSETKDDAKKAKVASTTPERKKTDTKNHSLSFKIEGTVDSTGKTGAKGTVVYTYSF